jgi:pimeloyl-ACP methyl ester carboxylesterase
VKRIAPIIFLLAALGSCTYLPTAFNPAPGVTETETRSAIFLVPSAGFTGSTGFMFYPGALVDPHAYVQWLSEVAAAGIPVVIAKASGNLAVLSIDAGIALLGSVAGVSQWVIGGHSLGGAMAAWSVYDHPQAYVGIVFLAAYPGSGTSLAAWSRPVLSLSGSVDGLATPDKVSAALPLLPAPQQTITSTAAIPAGAGTASYQIPGGNHAQFGSYGAQDGDGTATIGAAAQQAIVVSAITTFFTKNGW